MELDFPASASLKRWSAPTAYFAAKFAGTSNRAELEPVAEAVQRAGIATSWFVRDVEHWRDFWSDHRSIMDECRRMITEADILFAEVSERGVGVGWECGFAAGIGKPVVAAARIDAAVSPNLAAVVDQLIRYRCPEEITAALVRLRGGRCE